MKSLFSLVICLVAWTLPGDLQVHGQETASPARQETAAGAWKWTRPGINGDVRCELHLANDDGKLSGTYKDSDDVTARVGSVNLKGDEITVKLEMDQGGKTSEVTLSGKIAGDRITGRIRSASGESDWKARKFLTLDDLAGTWQLEFTTPDGTTREPEFELSVEDGKPVVEFTDTGAAEAGEADIKDVRYKNGFLYIDMALDFQGQELVLEYEFEMMPDSLEGNMYFQFGDESAGMNGDVDVAGTRIK